MRHAYGSNVNQHKKQTAMTPSQSDNHGKRRAIHAKRMLGGETDHRVKSRIECIEGNKENVPWQQM